MALSEEKLCSVGCKWMYTFNCLEAKKFIPAYCNRSGKRRWNFGSTTR